MSMLPVPDSEGGAAKALTGTLLLGFLLPPPPPAAAAALAASGLGGGWCCLLPEPRLGLGPERKAKP